MLFAKFTDELFFCVRYRSLLRTNCIVVDERALTALV